MRLANSVAPSDGRIVSDARQIAARLKYRGHDVHIATDVAASAASSSTQIARGLGRTLWCEFRSMTQLLRLLLRRRIQVLYRHAGLATWRERFAARVARVPIVQGADVLRSSHEENLALASLSTESNASLCTLENSIRSAYVRFSRHEIPILCYHRLVTCESDCGMFATHIRAELFEQHLRYLRDNGYRTLHFADLDTAQTFDRTDRAVMLTFDDGYEDNYHLLFPLLKQYGAKAVIYLVSGCTENTWDSSRGERSLGLLSDVQCAEMLASGLVEFGAHSETHPDLSAISAADACREISKSKAALQAKLGVSVDTFAYRYGRLNGDVKAIVRQAGFRFGIATHSGPLAVHEDPFQVRRIVVCPNTSLRRFKRKVTGRYTFYRAASLRAE